MSSMDDCDMSEEKTEKAFRNNIKKIWTVEQDERLKELVSQHGMGWTKIGEVFGERNGKQCRERWYNHLDPAVNKGEWTLEEDKVLFTMQREIGNHWAKITKALPGRTDNAIKNRFNAACRNHSLFMAANAASGAAVKDITLFDALHMHDSKVVPVDKLGQPIKPLNAQAPIPESPYALLQYNGYVTATPGTAVADYSNLGARSLSPSDFNESSKYQRVDIKRELQPQDIIQQQQQQHQTLLQQQQQLQLLQQRQQLNQHIHQQQLQQQQLQQTQQYQQYQQYQVQQEHQIQLMQQQLQAQSLPVSQMRRQQSYPPLAVATVKPTLVPPKTSFSVPSLDFRSVRLGSIGPDGEPPLTPGLFDRVALAGFGLTSALSRASPVALVAPTTQTQDRRVVVAQQATPLASLDASSSFSNGSNAMNNGVYSPTGSNSGGFIDFDESIFEDWVSDDTEMDFIEGSDEPIVKTSYDYVKEGCNASLNFCSGSTSMTTTRASLYEYSAHHRSSMYEQTTSSLCCGFPTGYSSEILEGRRHLTQQAIQIQPLACNQQMKSAGFTGAVRSIGGRICGPGLLDSSYQPLENVYSASSSGQVDARYAGGLPQDRSYSPHGAQYDQNNCYQGSSDTLGTSLGSRSSGLGGSGYNNYAPEGQGQVRSNFSSYFASTPSVPTSQNQNQNTNQNIATVPYMNPIYRFVNGPPSTSSAANS